MDTDGLKQVVGWLLAIMVVLIIIFFIAKLRTSNPISNSTIDKTLDPNNLKAFFILPLGAIFKYSRGKKSIARGGL